MVTEKERKHQASLKLAKIIVGLFFSGFLFISTSAWAATMYVSPSSGSRQVGKNFTVSVYVSSPSETMNAASGDIAVSESLEVVGISKSGSIFSLWAQEPSFSAGSVRFEGVVLNPGFKGSGGKLLSITLRPKASGDGEVRFISGSVLANDGNGTNILTSLGSANFSLEISNTAPDPEESTPTVEVTGVPAAPRVSSPNCSGPEGWCIGNDPKFSWVLPVGVNGVSIMGDHSPSTNPGTVSDGLMSSYTYTDVADGTWYFHIRLKNSYGWGGITHFKFQIDTKNPDFFELSLAESIPVLDPRARLLMSAKDSGSGISKYEIKIDNEQSQSWVDDGPHVFVTGPLLPGKHTVVAKAIDAAGNYLTDSLEITVDPMEAPKITGYPEQLTVGDTLIIKGQSYPDAKVAVYVQKEGSQPNKQFARADASGNFKFIFEGKLSDGLYSVWAEAENESGAKSNPSEKVSIVVSQRAILRIGSLLVSYMSVLISLLALLALLVGGIWYSWIRFFAFKRKVRRDMGEVEKGIHKAFDILRESARKQISNLEKVKLKRDLTKEEARILSQLKNQLNEAEEFINKEVEKIERELK